MKNILKALNQRPVAYYPVYAVGTGSIACAVALSQIMYWFGVSKDKIYKTDGELKEETGLSDKEIRNAKKKLKELSFLTVTREGVPAKTYYEIDWEMYQSSMSQWAKLGNRPKKESIRNILDETNGTNCTSRKGETITESTQRLPENTSPVADKSDDVTPVAFTDTMLEAIEVATHLSSKLSESMDNFKAPSTAGLHSWAKDIDLAIRKDNRSANELMDVINWMHDGAGTFWVANVKSGKKLRSQFDTMWFQMGESKPKIPIRDRALEAFGSSKVFFKFIDKASDREVHVCLFGDYNALYDYRGNKYIDKVKADKVWTLIEDNFDNLVDEFKKGV